MLPARHVLSLLTLTLTALPASAEIVMLVPISDNTLIEWSEPLSAGSSPHVYAGRVGSTGNGTRRRALLRFDIESAIPPGSQIHAATLAMTVTQTVAGPHVIALHRATASWGEGESYSPGGAGVPAEPGDATWNLRFFPGEPWQTPGGDFLLVPSSSVLVASYGTYLWPSTPTLVADVQSWLDDPASNAGWVAVGDETTQTTVKQFASREALDASTRPSLTIEFTPPVSCVPADLDCDGKVDGSDVAALLGAWGVVTPGAAGDVVVDGKVDGADLAAVLASWSSSS